MSLRSIICRLFGCKKRAAPAKPLVGIYGDSLTAGTQEGAPAHLIAVPPVRRINELSRGGFYAVNLARPGATAALALDGGYGMPFGRWADHMREFPGEWVVLRFGGADYVLGTPGDTLRPQVAAMVEQARAAGKRPVLVGVPNLLPGILGVDDLLRTLAADMAVPFIEVSHIPVGASDKPDSIHPGQALSDRIVAEIAQQLGGLVRGE